MDKFRRRPPMEGFSRPGSLGGEAYDDDSVEGHIMDDERTQDVDTEGHAKWPRADEDDTEGHRVLRRAEDDEDTEGHGLRRATDDDDTEGHLGGLKRSLSDDDEDTEGHAKTIR